MVDLLGNLLLDLLRIPKDLHRDLLRGFRVHPRDLMGLLGDLRYLLGDLKELGDLLGEPPHKWPSHEVPQELELVSHGHFT